MVRRRNKVFSLKQFKCWKTLFRYVSLFNVVVHQLFGWLIPTVRLLKAAISPKSFETFTIGMTIEVAVVLLLSIEPLKIFFNPVEQNYNKIPPRIPMEVYNLILTSILQICKRQHNLKPVLFENRFLDIITFFQAHLSKPSFFDIFLFFFLF